MNAGLKSGLHSPQKLSVRAHTELTRPLAGLHAGFQSVFCMIADVLSRTKYSRLLLLVQQFPQAFMSALIELSQFITVLKKDLIPYMQSTDGRFCLLRPSANNE